MAEWRECKASVDAFIGVCIARIHCLRGGLFGHVRRGDVADDIERLVKDYHAGYIFLLILSLTMTRVFFKSFDGDETSSIVDSMDRFF